MKRAGARDMHVPAFAQTESDRYTTNGVKTMLKNPLALPLPAGFVAGCNTMEGGAKTSSAGGEKLQDPAEKRKNN